MTNNLIINLLNTLDQYIMIDQNIGILKKDISCYYTIKPTTNVRFFFISKTIINSTLPNQGNVFGYPLSDNILKLSYNYCLKKKNESPFILKHNFKIFNYYNINLTKNYLNTNINNFIIENKNNVVKNNEIDSASPPITPPITPPTTPPTSDLNLTSSSSNESSSSSNMIDNEEKIIFFDNVRITIKNNIVTKVNKVLINKSKPIISNEELKYYLDNGQSKNNEENIFLSFFYKFLIKKNYYTFFKEQFFSLDENFITEFKILITFYYDKNEDFTLNEKKLDWFIQHRLKVKRDLLYQEIRELKMSQNYKQLKKDFPLDYMQLYYEESAINDRNYKIMRGLSKNKNNFKIFYNNVDQINLLFELEKILKIYNPYRVELKKNEDK